MGSRQTIQVTYIFFTLHILFCFLGYLFRIFLEFAILWTISKQAQLEFAILWTISKQAQYKKDNAFFPKIKETSVQLV